MRKAHATVGIDEVGLGAIAGPLVVCAVRVPPAWVPPKGLRDSKKMTTRQRERVNFELRNDQSLELALFSCTAAALDRQGVAVAKMDLYGKAISFFNEPESSTILDGDLRVPGATSIVKADDLYPCVSAASVLAKVYRDRLMRVYGAIFPAYGFGSNSGYLTQKHQSALQAAGPCAEHRRSFEPVRSMSHDRRKD